MIQSKIFRNCNVIYFKTQELPDIKGGKIIISDYPELNKLCSVKGLVHILNTIPNNVPSVKIDCIVCNQRDIDLENKLVRKGYEIPILYKELKEKWCGVCKTLSTFVEGAPVGKYCSEKCMRKSSGFVKNSSDILKDLEYNKLFEKNKTIIKFDKSLSKSKEPDKKSKSREKFQTSMVKEAVRLEYAIKREDYKKEMRQPSKRKAQLSQKKETTSPDKSVKFCISITKKGEKCTNKVIEGSEYCGITSHHV